MPERLPKALSAGAPARLRFSAPGRASEQAVGRDTKARASWQETIEPPSAALMVEARVKQAAYLVLDPSNSPTASAMGAPTGLACSHVHLGAIAARLASKEFKHNIDARRRPPSARADALSSAASTPQTRRVLKS